MIWIGVGATLKPLKGEANFPSEAMCEGEGAGTQFASLLVRELREAPRAAQELRRRSSCKSERACRERNGPKVPCPQGGPTISVLSATPCNRRSCWSFEVLWRNERPSREPGVHDGAQMCSQCGISSTPEKISTRHLDPDCPRKGGLPGYPAKLIKMGRERFVRRACGANSEFSCSIAQLRNFIAKAQQKALPPKMARSTHRRDRPKSI